MLPFRWFATIVSLPVVGAALIPSRLFAWVYRYPRVFPLVSDLFAWVGAGLVFWGLSQLVGVGDTVVFALCAVVIQASLGAMNGLYAGRWRVTSFAEVTSLLWTWAAAAVASMFTVQVFGSAGDDLGFLPVAAWSVSALAGMVLTRLAWRFHWERQHRPLADGRRRTIVFGAGQGGTQVIRTMLTDRSSGYFPVALLDDNPAKSNRDIQGVRVEGGRGDVAQVAKRYRADALLIAVVDIETAVVQELCRSAASVGVEVLVLPGSTKLVDGMKLSEARPPSIEDLLGREPVEIDLATVASYITGKSVLVTGAGGSIGSEVVRQVVGLDASVVHMLDRDESALHSLQLSLEGHALLDDDRLIVADIRDRQRMFDVVESCRPDVIFHAAALKHLTLLELHPSEAVKTNVIGTANTLDAAMAFGVERFVNLSTDKAAAPSSALGATKRSAEMLTAAAAQRSGYTYVSVRFGNVLGSRGSVLPTMLEQIRQGNPVTVTHPDVTRYFMTVPEAVKLVVQAAAIGEKGEVMILDMGEPVKILDLAERLVAMLDPSADIVFSGLRPGEKLHEVLLAPDEISSNRWHERIFHAPVESDSPLACLELMGPDAVELCRSLLTETSFGFLNEAVVDRAG